MNTQEAQFALLERVGAVLKSQHGVDPSELGVEQLYRLQELCNKNDDGYFDSEYVASQFMDSESTGADAMKANEPDYELECARTEGNAEQDSPEDHDMWEAFHQAIDRATPNDLCVMADRVEARMRRIILDHNHYAMRLARVAKRVDMGVVHFSEPEPALAPKEDDDVQF